MESQIEVEFVGEDAPLRVTELSQFLYFYKSSYAILFDKFGDISIENIVDSYEGIAKDAAYLLENAQTNNRITSSFFYDLGERDIYIGQIKKESPLLITFVVFGSAALIAAIIAGGEIQVGGFGVKIKVKFNRLGDGIGALRDAFRGKPRKPYKPKRQQ